MWATICALNQGSPPADRFSYGAIPAGWHLLSLPLTTLRSELHNIFPDAVSAFVWQDWYVSVDSVVPCTGYWVNLGTGGTYCICGTSVTQCVVSAPPGWSLLPVPDSDVPIPATSIEQDPADIILSVFGWNGGYATADELVPGQAYWMNLSQAGALTVRGATT